MRSLGHLFIGSTLVAVRTSLFWSLAGLVLCVSVPALLFLSPEKTRIVFSAPLKLLDHDVLAFKGSAPNGSFSYHELGAIQRLLNSKSNERYLIRLSGAFNQSRCSSELSIDRDFLRLRSLPDQFPSFNILTKADLIEVVRPSDPQQPLVFNIALYVFREQPLMAAALAQHAAMVEFDVIGANALSCLDKVWRERIGGKQSS